MNEYITNEVGRREDTFGALPWRRVFDPVKSFSLLISASSSLFSLFLARRFFSLREIHRSNPSLPAHFVSGLFSCVLENEENNIPLHLSSPFSFLPYDSFPAFFPFYIAVRFLRYASEKPGDHSMRSKR